MNILNDKLSYQNVFTNDNIITYECEKYQDILHDDNDMMHNNNDDTSIWIFDNFIPQYEKILNNFSDQINGIRGKNIKHDNIYNEIERERQHSNAEENLGIWKEKEKRDTDWKKIIDLCSNILINQSKDLQVIGWLIEATINKFGLIALLDCARLLIKFIETFELNIYPEELDAQENVIEWIDRIVLKALLKIKISTRGSSPFLLANLIGQIKQQKTNEIKRAMQDHSNDLIKTNIKIINNLKILNQYIYSSKNNNLAICKGAFNNTIQTLLLYKTKLEEYDQLLVEQNFQKFLKTENKEEKIKTDEKMINIVDDFSNVIEITKKIEQIKPQEISTYILKKAIMWKDKTFVDFVQEYGGNKEEFFIILKFLDIMK